MFSEAYRELCIENQEVLQEEWEKRGLNLGDFHWFEGQVRVMWHPVLGKLAGDIWFPRLGQLIEMLEERGVLSWVVGRVGPNHPDCDPMEEVEEGVKYYASPMPISKETISEGPDPATALLRAYLEVIDAKDNHLP